MEKRKISLQLIVLFILMGCSANRQIKDGDVNLEFIDTKTVPIFAQIIVTPEVKNEKFLNKSGNMRIDLYPGNVNILKKALLKIFKEVKIADVENSKYECDINVYSQNYVVIKDDEQPVFIQEIELKDAKTKLTIEKFSETILLDDRKSKRKVYTVTAIATLGLAAPPLVQLSASEIKSILTEAISLASSQNIKKIKNSEIVANYKSNERASKVEETVLIKLWNKEYTTRIERLIADDLKDNERKFTSYYSKDDYFNDLIKDGKYEAALSYYNTDLKNIEQSKIAESTLKNLNHKLNIKYDGLFEQSIQALYILQSDPKYNSDLSLKSEAFKRINLLIHNYSNIANISGDSLNSIHYDKLQKIGLIFLDQEFIKFDIYGSKSFFDYYPNDSICLKAITPRLIEKINLINQNDMNRFNSIWSNYSEVIKVDRNFYDDFSRKFLNCYRLNYGLDYNRNVHDYLMASKFIAANGLSEKCLEKLSFAVITTYHANSASIPIEIDNDSKDFKIINLPKYELDQIKRENINNVVFIRINEVQLERNLDSRNKVESKYVSSYEIVSNPSYLQLQNLVSSLQQELLIAKAQQSSTSGYTTDVSKALKGLSNTITVTSLQSQLRKAQEVLYNTPPQIKIPQYSKYYIDIEEISIKKTIHCDLFFYSLNSHEYFKESTILSSERKFRVAKNVNSDDPEKDVYLNNSNNYEDITKWEEEGIKIAFSELTEKINQNDSVKMIAGLPDYEANKVEERKIQRKEKAANEYINEDKRFQSVVVIYDENGSIGSGFYINSDTIITNYHVIEKSNYVEIKNFNGKIFFGKVTRSDPLLDLALVRVHEKGFAVDIMKNGKISIGDTVEAIGHPSGLEFSMTRGVISAVRRHKIGDRNLLIIQTDTPINPGNSGGPLYYKNEVIGISTQKLVHTDIEGIGFAIHSDEISNFIGN